MRSTFCKLLTLLTTAILATVAVSACRPATPTAQHERERDEARLLEPVSLGAEEQLQVVATTNIVGDVVRNVGGDKIDLTVLMGIGVDPHTYVPTPSDSAAIHDAHVVFASGAGLEVHLEEMLANAGGEAAHVRISDGLELLDAPDGHGPDEGEREHDDGNPDPHVWFNVQNVVLWVESIEQTLSALDPHNAEYYGENAHRYILELQDLDAWVQEQVATIPKANRKLVTSHPAFGYFAERYGVEQLGAVYPVSPSSEPSAQDITALEDAINEHGVPAVFGESTVNPKLAEQIAEDTGIRLVALYTGSLGGPGSGAETYILLIRYDVAAIVNALK